ncbi:MAG: ABC transporter substrate-binding protein, partial [Lachnospiraceae bacterium]|nr:ABC transporter substrate-binding protein [Lachnospiraceae bacterium]
GNFVVAREDTDDFEWSDLIGKDVLGGRAGGMPEMVFEYILKENGIDPSEVNINQSIDFGSTAAAFSGGQGDYTIEFEPSATALEQEGVGYVVESLGTASGYVPYTAYCAKESYLEEHPEVIQAFTNALQKGMDYVNSHTPEEIAAVIAPQFPENDEETIATIVKRYYEQDTWKEELIFEEESFALLQDILESAGELKERVPYEKLVTIEFAEAAVQ